MQLRQGVAAWLGAALLGLAVAARGGDLVISEIMYNPVGATNLPTDGEQYEFVEICNTGPTSVVLAGSYLTNGVSFVFPSGRSLGPGSYLVVAKNLTAFAARYPLVTNVLGSYSGKLANSGDTVTLKNAAGVSLFGVTFGDGPKWPQAADGRGASLVLVNPEGDPDDPSSWRASSELHGSPGSVGQPAVCDIVINEILAHTDPPLEDAIELHNITTNAVNMTGWYLSDDPVVRKKYRITNAVVQANGYAVIYQHSFSSTNDPKTTPFSLSELGEAVYLTAANAQSNLTRAVAFVDFGASSNGMSFGRYPNGTGDLVPMAERSLGGSNGLPRVGPVVISEIMYHNPGDDPQAEYLELLNIAAGPVPLFDPDFPTNTWRIADGVNFVFPTNVVVPGGGRLVVTGATNLPAFRAMYALSADVPVYGAWSGRLDNAGERIRLEVPSTPETNMVPYVLIEDIDYDSSAPWPTAPDGKGSSLERLDPSSYGNVAANWFAGAPGGTPGRAPLGGFVNPSLFPTSPVPGGVFTATVAMVSASLPTQVLFRSAINGLENTYVMHDDGTNGDAIAGDRVYAAVVASPAADVWVYHRFEAYGTNGQSASLPASTGGYLPSPTLTVRMSGGGLLTNVQPTSAWTTYTYTGSATHSNLFYVYLDAAGEALVDDLSVKEEDSQVESMAGGDFSGPLVGWSPAGTHAGTYREELQEESGNGVMHLMATGPGGGLADSASALLSPPVTTGRTVIVSFRARCATLAAPQWFWAAAGAPPADVVLNEIMYHPVDTNESALEYVELYNPLAVTSSLGGARLEGVGFTFSAGTELAPYSYLVCCASQEVIRATYGITNTVGNWSGRLQNDGETLRLLNSYGREMDRATYSDRAPWPVAADGMGPSLERISADSAASSSVNWASSQASTNWQHLAWTGQVSAANSGILFYLDFEGKVTVDDVSVKAEGSANELVANGSFEAGTNGWTFLGNHVTSRAVPGTGRSGSQGLVVVGNATRLVVQSGSGYSLTVYGDPESNAVASLPLAVSNGQNYVVSYWARRDGLGESLYAVADPVTNRVSFATRGTPGAANSAAGQSPPPGISSVTTLYDVCPPGTANVVRARMTSPSLVAGVQLRYRAVSSNSYRFADASYTNLTMLDNGVTPDLLAGDGEYAVQVPVVSSVPRIVRYHVLATGTSGSVAQLPAPDDPSRDFGYWISGASIQTALPNWQLFVDGDPVTYPVSKRACAVSPSGKVFTDVRVRHRGYPYPLEPETSGIAVRMNKGRLLDTWFADGQDGIDLRHRGNLSQWTQQRVVNEVLAYELQRQIGLATPRVRHVCLWINGAATITTELEAPGEAFLSGNSIGKNDFVSRSGYGGRGMVGGDETQDNFNAVYDLLANVTGADKNESVRTNLCYESVMYAMGLLSLTGNGDQYFDWNMFQHRRASDGRWCQYPWDTDFSFDPLPSGSFFAQTTLHPYYQTPLHPSIASGVRSHLLGKTLFYPETGTDSEYTLPYRHRHQMLLWRYFSTLYSTNNLFPRLNALRSSLTPAYVQIGADPALMSNQVAAVKAFIAERREFFLNGVWSDKNTNIWNSANVYNPSNVVINELMCQPLTGPEYLELYNPGQQDIDLSWWTLSVGAESYHLPHGTMIGSHKYLVITDNEASLTNTYSSLADGANLVERYPGYGLWDWPVTWTAATEYATRIVQVPALSLANVSASVTLTDLLGKSIDSVAYSNTPPWPASPGVSIGLADALADNALPASWRLSLGVGSPAAFNSLVPGPTIEVTPTGGSFGFVLTGSTSNVTFAVRNAGSGTLSGGASVSAPFSIVSGGSYSLAAGQSSSVTVRYSPAAAGTNGSTLTFTGGGGTTRQLTGTGYVSRTLKVVSPYGSPQPPVGTSARQYYGAPTSAWIDNSPDDRGTTQYVCKGWTGTGSVPASGNGTNTGPFLLVNNSSILWLWITNYRLTTLTSGSGFVNVGSGLYAAGASVTIRATPLGSARFFGWAGDLAGASISGSNITVKMTSARSIRANFGLNLSVQAAGLDGSSKTATIGVAPNDYFNRASGATPFTFAYAEGSTVALAAPLTLAGGWRLSGWAGVDTQSGSNATVTLMSNTVVRALYGPAPVVVITNPTTSASLTTTNRTLDIRGRASNRCDIVRVEVSSTRSGTWPCTGTTNWTCAGVTLYSGVNVITATAYDIFGNSASDALTVTYSSRFAGLQSLALLGGAVVRDVRMGDSLVPGSTNRIQWQVESYEPVLSGLKIRLPPGGNVTNVTLNGVLVGSTDGTAAIGEWRSRLFSFESDWVVPDIVGLCRVRFLTSRLDGFAYMIANVPCDTDARPYGPDGKEIARDIVGVGPAAAGQSQTLQKAAVAFEKLDQSQLRAGCVVQSIQLGDVLLPGSVATCRWSVLCYPPVKSRIRIDLPSEADFMGTGALKTSSGAAWRLPKTGKLVEYNGLLANDSLDKAGNSYAAKLYAYQCIWTVPNDPGPCRISFEVAPGSLTNWIGAVLPDGADGRIVGSEGLQIERDIQSNGIPATALAMGVTNATGSLAYSGDADWYQIDVVTSGTYRAQTFLGTIPDTLMKLYGPDEQGAFLEGNDNAVGLASRIIRPLAPGTYYLKITAPSGKVGTYRAVVSP
jgi:hypothetical protein